MKKIVLFLLLSGLFNLGIYAQGIEFEHGTWAEVVAKAKKNNKPIFIDVYTAWCGPCKIMSKNVFPDKQVGDTYNAAFINYKIDAEKGEGIDIAKKYGVKSYPTFLFISQKDLSVFHRESAAVSANEFRLLAEVALQKGGYSIKSKSSEEYGKEFEAGNRNPDFLVAYMKQNTMEKKSNDQLVDTLFQYLPIAQRLEKPYVEELALNVATVSSPLFGFLAENHATVNKAIGSGSQAFFESAMIVATRTVSAYKGQPDVLIPQRMKLFFDMIQYKPQYVESFYYGPLGRYYKNIQDTVSFLTMAAEYANTLLFPMTKEQLEQADRNAIADATDKLARGEVDSAYFKAKTRNPRVNVEQGSIRTTNLALDVVRWGKAQKDKELAENLMKHALSINPSANNKLQLAVIQQLIGKTEDARQTLDKAMEEDRANAERLRQRFDALTRAR